jgi:hypothetical protein
VECRECGAILPGDEGCIDRFHLLLAAEQHYPEAAAMHGLFVLTYYAQHPSLSKLWLRGCQREVMREIFGQGRDWREVLAWPTSRQRRQYAVDQQKERFADVPETRVFGHPITGEKTVASLSMPGSTGYPSKYPDEVSAWAKSVAEHRLLTD